jgi:hypothetical protein
MACFLVSGGEAIVATAIRAAVKKNEEAKGIVDHEGNQLTDPAEHGICWTRKISWLINLLWGGVLLLAIEHMWHGEVVPFPPFLTAMNDPGDTAEMLHEMSTIGVTMAIIVTVVWAIMMFVADKIMARPDAEPAKAAA